MGLRPYAGEVTAKESVEIDKLVAGGDGLARFSDGRVVFVPGVVPGETVEAEIVDSQRDFARARLVSVVSASDKRRIPPCPQVERRCGGCDWQHIDRHAQGAFKRAIAAESYARTGRMDVELLLRRIPDGARRTTVRVASEGNGAGFRMVGSHEVVPTAECIVAHRLVNELLAAPLLDGAGEVTIRVGARTGDIAAWCHEGRLVEGLGVDRVDLRTGRNARITEIVDGRTYEVSMESFFQSSPEAAELIIDSVRRRLDRLGASGGVLVDAYGGVGLFALAFADRFDEMVLVEESRSACRDAVRNLADTATVVENSRLEQWEPVAASTVIADPARQGLGKQGARTLVDTGAGQILLVSCDPVAAARDARYLVEAGYDLVEAEVLDIFPETHHVEVVAAFSRRRSDR